MFDNYNYNYDLKDENDEDGDWIDELELIDILDED